MGSTILNSIIQMISALSSWFTTLLNSTGTGAIYIGFVTIALAVSFLLARFGALLTLGSDTVSAGVREVSKGGGKYASGNFTNSRQKTGRFSPGVDRNTSISQYHRKK